MLSPVRLRKPLVLAFLFTSGATGLVYQFVWSRYLSNLLGNSGQAYSIVVATFMGGLAAGAWLFGRAADRAKKPLALYGLLELGVAAYALAFPWILDGLGAVYLKLAPALPEDGRIVPKLLLAASSLVVPTLLMGGTLPALARHFTSHLGAVQREVARLYAVNSLGAAFGAFLAGVRAVPEFGLLASSRGAVAANLVLALGAIALARLERDAGDGAEVPASQPLQEYGRAAARAALFGVALTGFSSMLLELSWIRVLTLTLGASTYAFTLILTSFILGIGLGSFWLARRKEQGGDGLRLFAQLQFAQLVAVCVAVPLYTRLPYHFWQARAALNPTLATWPIYQGITFFFCGAVLLVPTFFMGAAFPAVARVATSNVKALGRQLGGVYLWNTVGTILGSALGGLVLMPAIGVEGNFLLAAAVTAGTGLLAWWYSPTRGAWSLKTAWPAASAVVVLLAFVGLGRGWSAGLAQAGAFRSIGPPPPSFARFEAMMHELDGHPLEIRFREDDTFATVTVGVVPKTGFKFIGLNGKADASNSRDMETMILTGQLGMLLHERPVKRVLVIGAGSAVTVGAVLTHPVEEVDLVEISPAMLRAARYFDEENFRALDDPRVKVHIEDAKTFMALAGKSYDLIISEPSNPWVSGVSGLFTREFFQTVRAHLAPGGRLVQWLQAYETDDELIRLVTRTLRETFPHATTWLGPVDMLFVAGTSPLEVDFAELQRRMAQPKVRADLARVHLSDAYALLSKQLHSDEGQARFAGQGLINTDDHNVLEYAAPIAFFLRRSGRADDERYGPDGGRNLLLARYQLQHPPTAAELGRFYQNLKVVHPTGDPLRRAVASRWFEAAPSDRDAALALAAEAARQWDFAAADPAMAVVVGAGPLDHEALGVWLELEGRRAKRHRQNQRPLPAFDEALARRAVAAGGEDRKLREAVFRFCRAVKAPPCPQPPGFAEAAASSH